MNQLQHAASAVRLYSSSYEDEAQIIIHQHIGPFGVRTLTYDWQGDERAPVFIGIEHLEDIGATSARAGMPDTLEIFPWRLRKVRDVEPFCMPGAWYMREEGMWMSARLLWRIRQAFRWLEARIVLTLYVWGLARYAPHTAPSWRDIGKRNSL